jgi:hypothetical protein
MAYLNEHKAKFDNLAVALHLDNRTQLKRVANGGNTILFTYPPIEEQLYLNKALELFDEETYEIINISELFVGYIDEDGINEFVSLYEELHPSSHKAFFDSQDTHEDLFDKVIDSIKNASISKKVPVLIRTGIFYGTGVENINITDHKDIMALEYPLVIFYPGEMDGDNHHFLNAKQASKYRCTIIE